MDDFDEAHRALRENGFVQESDKAWRGVFHPEEIEVKVTLPKGFPSDLPEICLDRGKLPHRIPHVEMSGKICIAPTTGVLLDSQRPGDIVRQALEMAQRTVADGLGRINQNDLIAEFLAYWDAGLEEKICSICSQEGKSRQVVLFELSTWKGVENCHRLLADNDQQAHDWSTRIGHKISSRDECFFLCLESAFLPPDFGKTYTIKELFVLLRTHTNTRDIEILFQWLSRVHLPLIIILAIPPGTSKGRSLAAVRIPELSQAAAKLARKGWRADHVFARREIDFGLKEEIKRVKIIRLDRAFLVTRGGGDDALGSKTIAVVGCGSVGSQVVQQFAAAGVGTLKLIDHEVMGPENIHRHVLGMEAIGENKALEMKRLLGIRFPHIRVQALDRKVQEVLAEKKSFLLESDLIVIAVGDDTLEIWLNRELGRTKPRIHVWTEPLGIGQHALFVGSTGGCFQCLFEEHAEFGQVKRSSFAGSGQNFDVSIAGCGGSYIRFSANEAIQAALMATSLGFSVLQGDQTASVLVSRMGNRKVFEKEGYKVSKRANIFQLDEIHKEDNFTRVGCLGCESATV